MTTRPSRAGSATQSAVSSSGAARCSVFCSENQEPKPPAPHRASKNCDRRLAEHQQEQANRSRRRAAPAAGSAIASGRPAQADSRSARRPGADGCQGAVQGDRSRGRASGRLRRSSRPRPRPGSSSISSSIAVSPKRLPGGHDALPLLSLSGPLKTAKPPFIISALTRVGLRLARASLDRRPVGAHLDEALGQAAADEVGQRLAGLRPSRRTSCRPWPSSTRRRSGSPSGASGDWLAW